MYIVSFSQAPRAVFTDRVRSVGLLKPFHAGTVRGVQVRPKALFKMGIPIFFGSRLNIFWAVSI